jgi:NADPH:quinone reductase-like Zn-dependent oxidoreductase/malonyl CoA-acyl carrier protein transacylase/SAM-dependent methyltransferase
MSCAVQLALVCLLEEWGIKPHAVCSHSSGEVAAAFAAGALDLREAMACTYFRGLINADNVGTSKAEGAMAAIGLGPEEAQRYIDEAAAGKLVIACVNSPSSVTISGDRSGIDELLARFNAEGIFARKLKVQAAFHSHHMFALEKDYRAALSTHLHRGKRTFRDGVQFYSPVQGGLVDDATELGPEQWIRNMVQPVLFAQCFHKMVMSDPRADNGQPATPNIDVIIEVGPHGALAGPIRQCLAIPELKTLRIPYGSCLTRGENAVSTAQAMAGLLFAKGLDVDMAQVNFPGGGVGLRALSGLPSYPWSHTSRFWNESRISREHRFRKHPIHDLLGHRVPGLSGQMPVWRHVLRASEVPWTYDHVVQSNIVYPGSGYIAMAIEAIRQLHDEEEHRITGYSFRDVDILKAMIIPEDDDGVEVQLFLEPVDDNSLVEGWRRFHIYSATTQVDDWAEMAKGFISLEFAATAGSTQAGKPFAFKGTSRLGLGADMEAYPKKMSPKDLFKSLHAVGVNHGPRFQNLTRIRMADDTAFTTFDVADSEASMPHAFQQPHVIHPITLDAVFQSAYPTLSPEKRKLVGTAIPRHVKRLYISAAVSCEAGQSLRQYSSLLNCNRQGFEVSAAVLPDGGDGSSSPVIEVENMRFQSLGASGEDEDATTQEQLCLLTEWKESFTLNRHDLLKAKLQNVAPEEEKALAQEITRATYHLVHDALSQLTEEDIGDLDWHHKALYEWMLLLRRQADANELSSRSSRWATTSKGVKEMLYDKVQRASVHGALVVKVGRNMPGILRREIAPLELMLQDQLLYKFYQQALRFGRSTAHAAEVARAIAAEQPRARFLEIGAGTGGCTMPVLQALGGGDTGLPVQFEHYDFTDVSSGFFQAAKERFQAWDGLIDYKTLNIEEDVEVQGLLGSGSEPARYDVIVAAQVLHATKKLSHTLNNVRKLLKDGGRLILVETTRDTPDLTLIFGTVPGWWLSDEPERKHSPNVGLGDWDRILREAGFSGLDLNVWDSEDAGHRSLSCMVSTATAAPRVDFGSENLVLVYDDEDAAPPSEWCKELTTSLSDKTGLSVELSSLSELDATGKLCIFLSGLGGTPQKFDETKFEQIRRMIMFSKGILWVTTGSTMDCEMPDNAVHLGLMRTARIEDSSRVFASLDLDPAQSTWRAETQAIISRVFVAAMDKNKTPGTVDFEYAERNSQVLVPRLHRDQAENEAFLGEEAAASRVPELVRFMQKPEEEQGRVLRLHVDVPGLLDSVVFRDDAEARQPLPDGWVEIEPRAFGLNFRDIMVAMGKLDEPIQELGNECGGVVTCIGPGVPTGLELKAGDRVCALTLHGHFANRVRVPWTSVARIPDHVGFEEAASFVVVFVTAYCALLEAGRAEKGETVLVHAAAGGVGQACIVLAQNQGVEVFATVGSQEKRDFLRSTYGIPDDHIFSSRDASFVTDVLAATGGRGVDIVINSLAGRLLDESWNLLAPYGRFIEIGKKDIHSNKALGMEPFRKALSFVHVDIINLVDHKPQAAQRILQELVHMLGDKVITNIAPVTTFSLANIGRAFRVMQAGKHIGKIVIVPGPEDLVKVSSCPGFFLFFLCCPLPFVMAPPPLLVKSCLSVI